MRLIDADELKSLYYDAEFVGEKWHVPIHVILANIDDAPTIDPVKHGQWTVTPIYIICSECGESFPLVPQNYCPNCGALMDEVNE